MATVMADLAERVGFEPTETCASTVFKVDALSWRPTAAWSRPPYRRPQSDGNTDGSRRGAA